MAMCKFTSGEALALARRGRAGSDERQERARGWPYAVANALFLAYLVWAAPGMTRQIIASEGWSVIALASGSSISVRGSSQALRQ